MAASQHPHPSAPPLPSDSEYPPLLDPETRFLSGASSQTSRGEFPIDPEYGSLHFGFPAGGGGSYQQYVVPSEPPLGTPVYGVPVLLDLPPNWTTGLFDCCADVPICLFGCLFPCILFGKNAERLDDGMTSCATAAIVWCLLQQFTTCGWIYSWGYRRKLRSKYSMPQSFFLDCFVHFFCWPCAFCQEYRELHIRRLREEAAWSRRAAMIPPSHQMMQC